MERKYRLTSTNGTTEETGDTAGKTLVGLGQEMNVASMSVNDVLHELEAFQVFGTPPQFSRARTGKQALTLVAELRLMEIFGMDDPNQLVFPAYPADLAEKVKKHRDRVASDDAYQASILKKREEDNIRNAG